MAFGGYQRTALYGITSQNTAHSKVFIKMHWHFVCERWGFNYYRFSSE